MPLPRFKQWLKCSWVVGPLSWVRALAPGQMVVDTTSKRHQPLSSASPDLNDSGRGAGIGLIQSHKRQRLNLASTVHRTDALTLLHADVTGHGPCFPLQHLLVLAKQFLTRAEGKQAQSKTTGKGASTIKPPPVPTTTTITLDKMQVQTRTRAKFRLRAEALAQMSAIEELRHALLGVDALTT